MLLLKNSLVVCAIVLGTALGIQANTVPFDPPLERCNPTGNFNSLEHAHMGRCTIGDKIFSGFDFSSGGSHPITASHLDYSIINHGAAAIGFAFTPSGGMTVFNGKSISITVGFTVTTTGPDIKDASLVLGDGSFAIGRGAASITEAIHPAGGGPQVLTVVARGDRSAEVIFSPPVDVVAVTKTALVTAPLLGGVNVARISSFNETFSQVPEPRTMLLFGSGLLLIGIVVHRKQVRAKAGTIGLINVA